MRDVYYAAGTFLRGVTSLPGSPRNQVHIDPTGRADGLFFDRYGRAWTHRRPIPLDRCIKESARLAQSWHFTVAGLAPKLGM